MSKMKSPKIYDPYLGTMWGNILDQYDNPAYNIRLYLKPDDAASTTGPSESTQPGTQADAASGDSARTDQPGATAATETKKIADKKIVILAQTGVTGVQIDDLEIQTGNQMDISGKALNGSFRIVQPGAANFLDQLIYARKYLGANDDQLRSNDYYMYLDINFLGYNVDTEEDISKYDDHEMGGGMTQITDTTTYKIKVTEIAVRLDNTGSQYDFKFAIADTIGFADEIYKLPTNMSIQGSTITEFLKGDKGLENRYNKVLTSMSTEYEVADQIEFNLSALLTDYGQKTPSSTGNPSQKLYIKDESIPTPDKDQNVETTTAPVFSGDVSTIEEQRQQADGAQVVGTQPTKVLPGALLTLKEGNSIYTVIAQILSMNKEFQSYVTRQKKLDDPGSKEVDDKKTFVAWFDVHCEIQNIKWDKKRNKYAKKYVYTPYLIEDARSDVALTTKELEWLDEKGDAGSSKEVPITAIATKRLQDLYNAGALHKSYFYVFTGLNDQIINLDINYEHAVTMLLPPKGGYVGDYSVVNAPALKNSQSINEDPTGDDKTKAATDAKNRESLVGLLNQIKGLADNIKNVADAVGRSPEELAGILKDTTGKATRKLAQSLDSATVERLTKKLGTSDSSDPKDTPTTNTEITVTNFGSYAPEVSGFLYAADFVQPQGSLTQEELEARGLISVDTPTDASRASAQTRSIPSPLSGITSDGPASVLMGYVYRSRETSGFLLEIDMTIRGDPYWLSNKNTGKFEYGKPTPDKTANPGNGKKNYFLLTVGTPSRYDYDVSDEDKNTGYWSDGRTSGVFSGLYYPTEWKHKFSGGIFTTELKASKEITVPLQWIKRVPPGEKPPAWDEILKDVDQEAVLKDVGLSLNKFKGGANGDAGGDGDGPSTYTPYAGTGSGPWANDKEFLSEVDRLAQKYDIDTNDLLGLMQAESGIDPSRTNSIGCTGLIQFCPDQAGGSYKTIGGQRVALADLKKMSRAEQMKYVEQYYDDVGLPKGASPGQLYTATYLPAYTKENSSFVVATAQGPNDAGAVRPSYYTQNKGLDVNKDGKITVGELGTVIANARRNIGL